MAEWNRRIDHIFSSPIICIASLRSFRAACSILFLLRWHRFTRYQRDSIRLSAPQSLFHFHIVTVCAIHKTVISARYDGVFLMDHPFCSRYGQLARMNIHAHISSHNSHASCERNFLLENIRYGLMICSDIAQVPFLRNFILQGNRKQTCNFTLDRYEIPLSRNTR
jgi:hypothetical protein